MTGATLPIRALPAACGGIAFLMRKSRKLPTVPGILPDFDERDSNGKAQASRYETV